MLTGAREAITLGVASVFQKMSSVSREGLKALSEEDPFREACLHIADSGYTQQPKVMKTPEAPMSEPIRSSMSKSSSHGSLRKMGTLSRNNSTRSVSGLFRKKKTTKEAFVATHPMLGPIFVLLRKEDEVDLIKATIVSQYAYAIQHIPTSDLRTVFVDNVLKEYFLSEKVLKTLQKEMLLPASGDALTEEINRLTGEVASKMKEGNHNDWEERLAPLEGLLTRLPNHILVDTLVLREKEPDIERSGIPYFIPSILGEVATHFVAPRSFSEVCHFFGISVVTPPKYEPLTWETRAKTGKNEEIAGHLAEILKTESAFLDRLEVLQQFNEHLVKNAAQSGLQSDRYAQCCCPHVGNLIREVKKLLEEAQSDSTSIAHVCEVYSRMLAPGSPLRTALSNYISDFHAAELRLPVDDTRAVQLKDSLERFRKEVLKRGDLQWKNLRSEPIQRLTRYPSLFKTLFEHTPKHHKDSAMMHRAYTTAHNMANEAQSLDQDYKESEFLSTLDSKLKFQGQLMSAGLKLICEVAADVKTSGSPAYGITIMLFNRCVVLLHRSEQKNKYLNKDKITLKELHPMGKYTLHDIMVVDDTDFQFRMTLPVSPASEGCLSDKGAKPHQTLLCNARNINDKRHFLRAFRHFRLLEEYSPSLRMRGLPSCHSLERLYATHYNGVDIYFRLVDLPKFGEDAKSAVGLVVFSRNQDLTEVIDKAKDSYRGFGLLRVFKKEGRFVTAIDEKAPNDKCRWFTPEYDLLPDWQDLETIKTDIRSDLRELAQLFYLKDSRDTQAYKQTFLPFLEGLWQKYQASLHRPSRDIIKIKEESPAKPLKTTKSASAPASIAAGAPLFGSTSHQLPPMQPVLREPLHRERGNLRKTAVTPAAFGRRVTRNTRQELSFLELLFSKVVGDGDGLRTKNLYREDSLQPEERQRSAFIVRALLTANGITRGIRDYLEEFSNRPEVLAFITKLYMAESGVADRLFDNRMRVGIKHAVIGCQGNPPDYDKLRCNLRHHLLSLKEVKQTCLKEILDHFRNVVKHEEENGVSEETLASMFVGTLLGEESAEMKLALQGMILRCPFTEKTLVRSGRRRGDVRDLQFNQSIDLLPVEASHDPATSTEKTDTAIAPPALEVTATKPPPFLNPIATSPPPFLNPIATNPLPFLHPVGTASACATKPCLEEDGSSQPVKRDVFATFTLPPPAQDDALTSTPLLAAVGPPATPARNQSLDGTILPEAPEEPVGPQIHIRGEALQDSDVGGNDNTFMKLQPEPASHEKSPKTIEKLGFQASSDTLCDGMDESAVLENSHGEHLNKLTLSEWQSESLLRRRAHSHSASTNGKVAAHHRRSSSFAGAKGISVEPALSQMTIAPTAEVEGSN